MKRLDPNLLLAISTGFALALVLLTTGIYGRDGDGPRNLLIAISCAGGFVLLNPVLQRAMKIPARPPMIHPDSPGTLLWAGLFPMVVMVAAAVPIFWPDHDFGLLVIIASVWFGVTLESAIKVLRSR